MMQKKRAKMKIMLKPSQANLGKDKLLKKVLRRKIKKNKSRSQDQTGKGKRRL